MRAVKVVSLLGAVVVILLLSGTRQAEAVLLGDALIFAGGETVPPTGPFAFAAFFGPFGFPGEPPKSFYLFNGLILDDLDVGNIYYADALSDPEFPNVVGILTNGQNDYVGGTTTYPAFLPFPAPGRASAGPEDGVFGRNPDFSGSTIERIGLRIGAFFTQDFPNQRVFRGTLLVEGIEGDRAPVIPEPSSLFFFGTGLLSLIKIRRRFARSLSHPKDGVRHSVC